MKRKLFLSIITVLVVSTILYSCKKVVNGCMDKDSVNYNSSATKDDGSCKYQSTGTFWWKKPFADSCNAYGIAALKLYINGAFKTTLPVSYQYWNSAPACGATNTLNCIIDMGSSKSMESTAKIDFVDGSNNVIISTTTSGTITPGCDTEELTW